MKHVGVEIAIVGGGVIGCAVARKLAGQGRQVMLLEKSKGIVAGENQSSRNSGVIHAGIYYDQATRPLKAALCARGSEMLYEYCGRHGIAHSRCGKILVARTPEQEKQLQELQRSALNNGVATELVSAEVVAGMEPGVTALSALSVPSSGVVEPTSLVAALAAGASNAGAVLTTGAELTGVTPRPEGLLLEVRRGDGSADEILATEVINCGGLYADQVSRMVNEDSPYRIDPMRGEAMCFRRGARPGLDAARMNIYPAPHQVTMPGGVYWTVGVHLTPVMERADVLGQWHMSETVLVGPLNFVAKGLDDYGGGLRATKEFWEQVTGFFPALQVSDLKPYQVGIQARLSGHQDWVVEKEPKEPRCINMLGIDSPGLTSCLAIAEHVADLLEE